jgi:hypothetical protein
MPSRRKTATVNGAESPFSARGEGEDSLAWNANERRKTRKADIGGHG